MNRKYRSRAGFPYARSDPKPITQIEPFSTFLKALISSPYKHIGKSLVLSAISLAGWELNHVQCRSRWAQYPGISAGRGAKQCSNSFSLLA